MRTCEWCGKGIVAKNAQARFCSSAHRVYAHRAAAATPIPRAMLERDRWLRWDLVSRKGRLEKVPFTTAGDYASSTDPTTWGDHSTAAKSSVGRGLGFALGDGIGCLDIDHCLNNGELDYETEVFLRDYPNHYIEVSPSGTGLHIWGTAPEGPGTKRRVNGVFIERYTTGRYITVTGNVYQRGELLPL